MNFKNLMIILIILAVIVSVGTVSAADATDIDEGDGVDDVVSVDDDSADDSDSEDDDEFEDDDSDFEDDEDDDEFEDDDSDFEDDEDDDDLDDDDSDFEDDEDDDEFEGYGYDYDLDEIRHKVDYDYGRYYGEGSAFDKYEIYKIRPNVGPVPIGIAYAGYGLDEDVAIATEGSPENSTDAGDDAVPVTDSSLQVNASNGGDAESDDITLERHPTANPISMLMIIFSILAICPSKRG